MTSLLFITTAFLLFLPGAAAQTTERVTHSLTGLPDLLSDHPSLSSSGRIVAYQSEATNLVPGDTNGLEDIFVYDRATGATERVSVSSSGVESDGPSLQPVISADGRLVAFWSSATNLVSGDSNGAEDVFVHDRTLDRTWRVSVDSAGQEANDRSYSVAISADGSLVGFVSSATNLVPGDTNGFGDAFVHDLTTGVTSRVSTTATGAQASGYCIDAPALSRDGRFVAFACTASNLSTGDTNATFDVFRKDRITGAVVRVSVSTSGVGGDTLSSRPDISDDGNRIVFHSYATNLVPVDTNNVMDAFLHDLTTGRTTRVSETAAGVQGQYHSLMPSISGDGGTVAFYSHDTSLIPGNQYQFDVYLHDVATGQLRDAHISSDGVEGYGNTLGYNALNQDGSVVAYSTNADNLDPTKPAFGYVVFVHGNELVLDADPPALAPGATGELVTLGSSSGLPGFLFVVGVNSTPWFQFVRQGTFDAGGTWVLPVAHSPAIAGNRFQLRSFAQSWYTGQPRGSNVATLSVQ